MTSVTAYIQVKDKGASVAEGALRLGGDQVEEPAHATSELRGNDATQKKHQIFALSRE